MNLENIICRLAHDGWTPDELVGHTCRIEPTPRWSPPSARIWLGVKCRVIGWKPNFIDYLVVDGPLMIVTELTFLEPFPEGYSGDKAYIPIANFRPLD